MLVDFSPEDRETLREMAREYRSRRPIYQRSSRDTDIGQASDIYIAYPTTSAGIPARTDGAGTANDVPGSATCDIYRISPAAGNDPELVQIPGIQRTVYNVYNTDAAQEYHVVTKTKSGAWVLGSLGGGALIGVRLAEDHPGKGTRFDVWVGTQSGDGWLYATGTDTEEAIDWRDNVDAPYKYATGLAFRRSSGLLEICDLDCPPAGTGTGT